MIELAEEVCDEEVGEILAYAPGIPESKEAYCEESDEEIKARLERFQAYGEAYYEGVLKGEV